MKNIVSIMKRIFLFYYEGFKNMSEWGKRVWIIIFIKLFIMFAILKIFFFPNFLKTKYDNDRDRSDYVLEQLINSQEKHD
jgi:hypothetical protein